MNVRLGSVIVGLSLVATVVVNGIGLETGVAQDKPKAKKAQKPQYDFEKESIPGASIDEPVLKELSLIHI